MRWAPFMILAAVLLLVQTTLARVLVFVVAPVGPVGPDLLAIAALFFALRARSGADAILAAWVLGFGLDLAAAGGTGSTTAVGPMAVAYALAAWLAFSIREAFFRERLTAQVFLALLCCSLAHLVWVTAQSLLAGSWSSYGRLLLQAACLSAYTAVLTPLGLAGLTRLQRWFLLAPGQPRRVRR